MLGYALMIYITISPDMDFTFLLSFGIWSMIFVQTGLQVYFAMTRDRTKTKKRRRQFKQSISSSAMNSSHFNLNVILNDKLLAKAFEDHLQKEFGVESLFFYQETKNWKMSFRDMSPSTRASRAKKIIKTFIKPDGIFCINIPSTISRAIVDASESSNPNFPAYDLFDDASEEVRDLLELGALARFKRTVIFKSLIDEGLQRLVPLDV